MIFGLLNCAIVTDLERPVKVTSGNRPINDFIVCIAKIQHMQCTKSISGWPTGCQSRLVVCESCRTVVEQKQTFPALIVAAVCRRALLLIHLRWSQLAILQEHDLIARRVWKGHRLNQCFIQAHLGGGESPPNFEFPPKNLRRGLLLCECNTCKLTECSKLTK